VSTDASFGAFLSASFALLAGEVPSVYRTMCRQLSPRSVQLRVDGELTCLEFCGERVRHVDALAQPVIEVETERETILGLVDARHNLMQAVLDDRLMLRGSPDDLLAFHEGLMTYLHGAFRAPSFRKLLLEFRGAPKPAARPTKLSRPAAQRRVGAANERRSNGTRQK
jgi:hypothetical protein